MKQIKVEDLYKEFLVKNEMTNIDEKQDWFLKRLFFAGFTSYRDAALVKLQEISDDDAMRQILVIDEELQEYWNQDSNFEV